MRRYVRDVEDFAVAGREMDLNLGIASLAATELGIVTVMYTAELGFKNGLAGAIPGVLGCLAMLLVGMTGFVIVPLRKAGVITIPELFEKRFGKRVRWLAGLVIVLGGVLNMGIFLRLGSEFLMYIAGFDPKLAFHVGLPGHTFQFGCLELVMVSLLAIVLLYTVLGGMISVLVTDYLQFLILGLGLVITSVLVIWNVGWPNLITGLERVHRTGQPYIQAAKDTAPAAHDLLSQPDQPSDAEPTGISGLPRQAVHTDHLRANAAELAENGVLIDTSNPKKPEEVAMSDPFDPIGGLGLMWFVWQAVLQIAVMTTWQTTIARVLSARDSKTAKRMYRRTSFYFVGRFALPGLWGAAAFLFFCARRSARGRRHPDRHAPVSRQDSAGGLHRHPGGRHARRRNVDRQRIPPDLGHGDLQRSDPALPAQSAVAAGQVAPGSADGRGDRRVPGVLWTLVRIARPRLGLPGNHR